MQGFLAGLARGMLFFRDASGYATGQQSTLANGSTSPAYVFDWPLTAGYQPPPAVNLDITGGDRHITTIQFGNAYTPPFDLAIADLDTVVETLISGMTPNTVNSFRTIVSTNPNLTVPRVLGLAIQQRYKLTSGAAYWLTTFFPACEMRLKKTQAAFQAKSDVIIACTPQMVTTDHHGRVFGTAGLALNLEGDKTDNYDVISARPIHITSFRSNASATTVNTVYKPISTVVTNNATPNLITKNAVPEALTSITLAGVATLAEAGSAADMYVLEYETDYVPV